MFGGPVSVDDESEAEVQAVNVSEAELLGIAMSKEEPLFVHRSRLGGRKGEGRKGLIDAREEAFEIVECGRMIQVGYSSEEERLYSKLGNMSARMTYRIHSKRTCEGRLLERRRLLHRLLLRRVTDVHPGTTAQG